MGAEALLLTPEEAAEQLRVSTKTLRKLRQSGLIRFVAVTERKILYRPADCAAFLDSRVRVEDPAPLARPQPGRREKGNVLSFTARRRERQSR